MSIYQIALVGGPWDNWGVIVLIEEHDETATITNLQSGQEWTGNVLDNGIETSIGGFTTLCPGNIDGDVSGLDGQGIRAVPY